VECKPIMKSESHAPSRV